MKPMLPRIESARSRREKRKAWLASLKVGDPVGIAMYNGQPPEQWKLHTVLRIEPKKLIVGADLPYEVDAIYLDNGVCFARDDGRLFLTSRNRRTHLPINERIEPPENT